MQNTQPTKDLLSSPIGDDITIGFIDADILSDGSDSIFSLEDVAATTIDNQFANDWHFVEEEESINSQPEQQEDPSPSLLLSNSNRLVPFQGMMWHEWDVPLGRCQEVREFIGNARFRELVDQRRGEYLATDRKMEKTGISLSIFGVIYSNGGRFMDKRKSTNKAAGEGEGEEGGWYEIPQEKALAKISQALRNGTRPLRSKKSSVAQKQLKNNHSVVPQSAPGMKSKTTPPALEMVESSTSNSASEPLEGLCISIPSCGPATTTTTMPQHEIAVLPVSQEANVMPDSSTSAEEAQHENCNDCWEQKQLRLLEQQQRAQDEWEQQLHLLHQRQQQLIMEEQECRAQLISYGGDSFRSTESSSTCFEL